MLLALALTYVSCLALSISMKRHFQQVFPTQELSIQKIKLLRSVGWILLISSCVLCAYLYSISTGLVLLCGLFSASALLIAMLLQYSPRIAIGLALIQLPLGLVVFLY